MNGECINCEIKLTDDNCTQGAMFCDVCENKIVEGEMKND
jgi:hypothetical protein